MKNIISDEKLDKIHSFIIKEIGAIPYFFIAMNNEGRSSISNIPPKHQVEALLMLLDHMNALQQKHVEKALKVQKRILKQVKNLEGENLLLYVFAAYNAELAISYQKIEDLNKELI